MSVTHQLARLAARERKTQALNNSIQSPLELLQQGFAGHAFGARGLFKVITELFFQREVHALGLLFLAQLQAVTHNLGLTVLAMLAGGKIALFHRALLAEALGTFEK